jgi:hypothetical protein
VRGLGRCAAAWSGPAGCASTALRVPPGFAGPGGRVETGPSVGRQRCTRRLANRRVGAGHASCRRGAGWYGPPAAGAPVRVLRGGAAGCRCGSGEREEDAVPAEDERGSGGADGGTAAEQASNGAGGGGFPDRSLIDLSRDPNPGVADHAAPDDAGDRPLIDLSRDPTPGEPDHAAPEDD